MWRRRPARGSKQRTYSFHNRSSRDTRLWLEPWAEEFRVPAGGTIDLRLFGRFDPSAEAPFELTEDHLVFFAPGGSCARVFIDGIEQESAAAELPVPQSGPLGTRGFIHTVFDGMPEARASGTVGNAASPVSDRLGSGMGEGNLRLEPLAEEHRAALQAACAQDLDIWPIYAWSWDPDHFDATFDRVMSLANWRRFAIFSGERLVGISCFIGVDEDRGVLEIGNTYYIPEMRGTGFNRRVKDLMIGRAIDCGFRRIEFRVDSRNARSQAAMAKLGAVREGVIRADRITWTGHVRDTVLFSILAREWDRDGA